jgi:hypothetical protein
MHRWGEQKPVHFDSGELNTNLGQGNFIFVGSSCDLFADEISLEWISKTLKHCSKFDNKYLFQSKNPYGIWLQKDELPKSSVICTTIETNRLYIDFMKDSPSPKDRGEHMELTNLPKYVTIEPIMDFDLYEMVALIKMCNPIQVNIGADSGNNHLPEPSKEKLLALIEELQKFTTIARKTNLARLLK